jgi:hypothetical protein
MVNEGMNDNKRLLDRMLEDKQTMTIEQLSEKYDLNTKWKRTKHLPKSDNDLKFYTLESFQTIMLNEYKSKLQHSPNLIPNILAVYCSVSKEYPLPYVTTIEYFPENKLQAQSVDLLVDIMTEEMGKHMKLNYTVRIYLTYNNNDDRINNRETLVSFASSFEGEVSLKTFDVIRIRRDKEKDEVSFNETHKMDKECLNIRYCDPKEEKKRQDFEKRKESMSGI